ncbi:MAG: hypothetical protein WDZ48_10610, partial [Pirellulales bacterium]
ADPTAKGLKAGEAYLRAIENDPDSKRGLMRARAHLQSFINAMNSPEFREALEAEHQAAQERIDAIRESVKQLGDELEVLHLPRPETLEDWQVLGRIVEIPEEYLQTGSWTAVEIFNRAMAWIEREKIKVKLAADVQAERENGRSKSPSTAPEPTKSKRSTERGEGRAKLIAALTKHHKYADGSCLNLESIGNNELARLAGVSESTASAFFNNEFNQGESRGYATYRVICRDPSRLADSLKVLNGEFSPHHLYGRTPPGERERDDDE